MAIHTAPLFTTAGGVLGASTVIVVEHGLQATQNISSGTYTASEVATFIAALGVLVTGVGAVIVNIIVALRTGTKIDDAAVKTETLVQSVKEVHAVTNSGLSAVKAELATSSALNTELRDIIADLKAERGKLAMASALAMPGASAPGTVVDKIETNTRETAQAVKHLEPHTKDTP